MIAKSAISKSIWVLKNEWFIKFRLHEKTTKFEKVSHLFWQNSCFTQYRQNKWEIFQMFVTFSEKLDFTDCWI